MPRRYNLAAKKLLGILGYTAFVCITVVVLLEASARFGYPESRFYRTIHSIKSDSSGPTVLLLGDSFITEGEGSYAMRIRGLVDYSGGELVNAAASGMGPEHYLRQASLLTEAISPDLILVNYFVGNDLTDTIYFSRTWIKQQIVSYLSPFYFGHVLTENVGRAQTLFRLALVNLLFDEEEVRVVASPLLFEAAKSLPNFMHDNLLVKSPEAQVAWSRNREVLNGISLLARRFDAAILIVIIPANLQVSDQELETMRKVGFRVDSSMVGTRIPQDLLLEFCGQRKLDCLDLLPAFLDSRELRTYLSMGVHWNAEGHRLAFETLKPHLSQILYSRGRLSR